MRLATIRTTRGPRLHVAGSAGYVDLADATGDDRLETMLAMAQLGGPALEAAQIASKLEGRAVAEGEYAPLIPNAPRILCLGLNYADHALEAGHDVPSWPECFVRGPGSLIGAYDDMIKPALSDRFDYEGELCVIIGKGGRYVPASEALQAILGFSVLNDGSAREWQRVAKQWIPGKNFESTMPIGPELVTKDEISVDDLAIETRVNGEVVQSARTSQMIVTVAKAIEYFSSFTMLRPGDVIAMGTPSGIGMARTPPRWLKTGDVVEVAIERIGRVSNRVVAEQDGPVDWPWQPEWAGN